MPGQMWPVGLDSDTYAQKQMISTSILSLKNFEYGEGQKAISTIVYFTSYMRNPCQIIIAINKQDSGGR